MKQKASQTRQFEISQAVQDEFTLNSAEILNKTPHGVINMASLKIVVFPGLEEITYSTEKKANSSNPVLEFLADRSSVTREELYTIEQISNRQTESEKMRKNMKNGRQFICPPILDLAMTRQNSETQTVNKPTRIFNGFFPSKIRTSTSPNSIRESKLNQEYEELVPDNMTSAYQLNGTFWGRAGSRSCPKSQQSLHGMSHRDQKVAYSLRNGSPSPWINRYQLKKSVISTYNAKELKNHSIDRGSRGFSR